MPQDATSNAVRDTKGLSGAASFHTLRNPTYNSLPSKTFPMSAIGKD